MKLAIYQWSQFSTKIIQEVSDFVETNDDYTRLTEIVDVEFPELPAETVVPNQIKNLSEVIAKERGDSMGRITVLEDRIAELRLLKHQVTDNVVDIES